MAAALVASAFGSGTTLYDALQCERNASLSDLKKAYHRRALLFHPDKVVHGRGDASKNNAANSSTKKESSSETRIKLATLKFQAVSAAYAVLMDPKQRARYDATGFAADNDDNDNDDDDDTSSPEKHGTRKSSSARSRSRGGGNNQQQQRNWDDFFYSVFGEVIHHNHGDAASYRGSDQERRDVLQAYEVCKGHWDKMVDCIIHGAPSDKVRWKRDIVMVAIQKGEIVGYGKDAIVAGDRRRRARVGGLVDSDNDNDNHNATKDVKKRLQKKSRLSKKKDKKSSTKKFPKASMDTNALTDTDDEEEQQLVPITTSPAQKAQSTTTTMSRKDKMEYRVAKKRKLKAEREMEVAELFQSKAWGQGSASGVKRKKWQGAFTDDLLANMEQKYSGKSNSNTKSRGNKRIKKR